MSESRAGPAPRPTEEERTFLEALAPLRASGKLGAVHYQFPPWLVAGTAGREAVLRTRERHPDDVLAVEFRHRSWFEQGRLADTEDLLRELDCTLVGVDAPQLGSGTAPPHLAVTSPRLVLVRFHGRNYQTWYRKAETTGERFDYLYPPPQLAAVGAGDPGRRRARHSRPRAHEQQSEQLRGGQRLRHGPPARRADLPRPPGPILRRMEERDGEVPELGAPMPPSLPRHPPPEGPPEIAGRTGCGTIGQLSLDV